jgi:hypothetical protein
MEQALDNLTAEEKAAFLAFIVQSGSKKRDIELMFLLESEPDEIILVEYDEALDSF